MTKFYAQHRSIEPWLKTDTPTPPKEWKQSREDREKLDGSSISASCAPAARRLVRAIGGIRTAISGRPFCSKPTAGSSTAVTRPRASGSTISKTRFGFTAATRL